MKASLPAELQGDDLSDDSDVMPSDLEDGATDEDGAEYQENSSDQDSHTDEQIGDDEDHEVFSMVEASDNEDLRSLNEDVPDGLIEFDGPESEAESEGEEWGGIAGSSSHKKRKRGEDDSSKKKRKKLRSLPTFASYEDYAKMIEDGPEDNI